MKWRQPSDIISIFFQLYSFKSKDEEIVQREWMEEKCVNTLAYLKRLFENKAQLSCTARDKNRDYLMLRGYMNLNLPCTQAYAKRLLGKYSSCKLSYFGDMVSLC